MTRVPASGWYVEVDHPDRSEPLTPTIVGDPTVKPTVNGFPRVEIPVRPDDRWSHPDFDGASMRVWQDGIRQPIDTLETPSFATGGDGRATVLQGRGGTELDERVQLEIQEATPAADVSRDVLSNVSYAANVDDYDADVELDKLVQDADTDAELTARLLNAISATDPKELSSGTIPTQQTSWTAEGEDAESSTGGNVVESTEYSGDGVTDDNGLAAGLGSPGDSRSYEFTTEHDIPEDAVGLYVRQETPGDATPGVEYRLNGTTVATLEYSSSIGRLSLGWDDMAEDPFGTGDGYTGGTLPAGTHTLTIEVVQGTADTADDLAVDVVAPQDTRYSYTFDNDVETNASGNNTLAGPELYPDAVPVVFEDIEVSRSVSGARLEATLDSTAGQQAVAVSNDFGKTFTSAPNTDTLETDFGDLGATLRARVTLSRYGTQNATPREGINGQALDAYELFADLDDTPLIVRESFDDTAANVLTRVLERSDGFWEFRRRGDTQSVEVTYSGQRQSDRDPSVTSFESSRTVAERYESITVRGSSRPVRGERITANHGTAVDLAQDKLLVGRERVSDPSTSPETVFEIGIDYEVDTQAGAITTLSGGAISDGQELAVDYAWRPEGTEAVDGVSDPREKVIDIPALATTRGCQNAALRILDQVDTPLEEARLVIPVGQSPRRQWNLVAELAPSALPLRGRVEIRSVESAAGQVVLTVGSRDSISDVVDDIRGRLTAVAERV